MPAAGTTYITGNRDLIFSKDLYKKIREKYNISLTDKEIKNIILESNSEIASIVSDTGDSFKLPEGIGYLVVTKYKSKKKPIDWKNSIRLKRKVLLPNLHSFGYIHHIKWFKRGVATFAFSDIYKIIPVRTLQRSVAHNIKAGKLYDNWTISDFWSRAKTLKKLYSK